MRLLLMEGGVETGEGFLEGGAGGTDVQAHEASAAGVEGLAVV